MAVETTGVAVALGGMAAIGQPAGAGPGLTTAAVRGLITVGSAYGQFLGGYYQLAADPSTGLPNMQVGAVAMVTAGASYLAPGFFGVGFQVRRGGASDGGRRGRHPDFERTRHGTTVSKLRWQLDETVKEVGAETSVSCLWLVCFRRWRRLLLGPGLVWNPLRVGSFIGTLGVLHFPHGFPATRRVARLSSFATD